jgi:hypothetical protein
MNWRREWLWKGFMGLSSGEGLAKKSTKWVRSA